MREILFKAKRIDNSEWVYGYYLCDGITGKVYIHDSGNSVNESDKVGYDGYLQFVAYEIDPETICQYTGLIDKNGKKIWENDLLRYSYDYPGSPWLKVKGLSDKDIKYSIGAVFWSDWRGAWAVCGGGTNRCINQDVFTYSRNPNRVEVIGNIFDNPDLLEVE